MYHYRKREWVSYVLEGCSDKEKAFMNWMNRDILFAQDVQKQCEQENYLSIINDESMKIEEIIEIVEKHLGL